MLVPVKDAEFNDSIKAVMSVGPKMAYDKNKSKDEPQDQKINQATGLPVWIIECAYKHVDDRSPDFASVQIAQASEPQIGDGPIRFSGLTCIVWKMGEKGGGSIFAKSYSQDSSPAVKTSAPPKPPTTDKK